jgi:hypothetical protein
LSYTQKESRLVAIQIHRNVSEWVYRIDPEDDRHIERRKIVKGTRWGHFKTCDTACPEGTEGAEAAREIILLMTEDPYRPALRHEGARLDK